MNTYRSWLLCTRLTTLSKILFLKIMITMKGVSRICGDTPFVVREKLVYKEMGKC